MVLALITHKESSEVEIFAFYCLLYFQFQNCINASCGQKKNVPKENFIHLESCE